MTSLEYLDGIIGNVLIAVILRLPDPEIPQRWLRGKGHPTPDQEHRLGVTETICRRLEQSKIDQWSWWFGPHEALHRRPPAMVMDDDAEAVLATVMRRDQRSARTSA